MATRPPRLSSILVAVVFALSVFGFTLFVWLSFGGNIPLKPKGYRFHVAFGSEAAQLSTGAEARISGVRVGEVVEINRSVRGTDAAIEMDSRFAPVKADTRAIIRFKTLLGENFIELTPGSRDAPALPEDATLAASQVEEVETVDEVLGAFDAPTRQAFKLFLADVSATLDDRGPDVNAALGNTAPTLDELRALVELLDAQQPAVEALVRNGGTALRAVGRRGREVRTLVRAGNAVLATTAARDDRIDQIVHELPPLLSETRLAFRDLEETAADAAPTLRALRPVAPLIRPGLESVSQLAPELEGLFGDLDPVLDSAEEGLPAARRIVREAGPLIDVLRPTLRELVPVVRLLYRYRREVVTTVAKIAASTQGTFLREDGSRVNVLRVLPPIWNEALVGYEERLPSNRYNPYFKPGGLANLAEEGLRSYDCRHTDNPALVPVIGTGAPPCLVQGPWPFGGERRFFPHVERDPD